MIDIKINEGNLERFAGQGGPEELLADITTTLQLIAIICNGGQTDPAAYAAIRGIIDCVCDVAKETLDEGVESLRKGAEQHES